MRLRDVPPDILKIIPPQYFAYCHCNPRIVFLNREFTSCRECGGTTWHFSEIAELRGYFRKKVRSLSWQEISRLPSWYFERCSCGSEPRSGEEREFLDAILELIGGADLSLR